jgi:hypothetical protein
MTSKGASDQGVSDQNATPETYEFVPDHLRRHFKVDANPFEDDDVKRQEQQLVRQARQSRSAHLVATLFSQPPPAPTQTQLVYSNATERAITARMTFSRALESLENYFLDMTAKVKQLEAQRPLDSSDVKTPTLVQIQRQIVNTCQGCLSDCDIYLGVYEALPSPPAASPTPVVRFVACSTKSSMLHRTLECPLRPAQEQPQSAENQSDARQAAAGITVQAMAAREAIIVDDVAELAPNELHRFVPAETSTGPFSSFPLVAGEATEGRAIGVLSVDACRKAHRLLPQSMSVEALHSFLLRMQLQDAATELKRAKMDGARFLALTEIDIRHKPSFQRFKVATRNRLLEIIRALQRGSPMHLPDAHERSPPFTQDDDALAFLDGVSRLSGRFLASYRRAHWLNEIADVTRSSSCTAYDVYDVLIRAITRSVEPLERVAVWRITHKTRDKASSAPNEWEIDVVASTAVPDDRLAPFLDGQERRLKRVALYKESEDAIRGSKESRSGGATALMRGGVINVMANATASAHSERPCESATYHVSWSDRSLQSVSWVQLRQLLPIRNMNAKHFQLRQLCHRLHEEEAQARQQRDQQEPASTPRTIRINDPNGVALVLRDESRPKPVQYALEVDFTAHFEPPQEVYAFLQQAVAAAEQAIKCVRGREARHAARKRAVARISQWFQAIGLNPSGDALRALDDIVAGVFEDITDNLPGVDVQLAELQAGGDQLRYTFAGPASTVLGCSLNRGQGLSFKCLDTKQPLVVGASSELRPRLQRLGALRSQPQATDNDAFPFIFVPLYHEDCAVGVLSVDGFRHVPKGRQDEAHPEAGTLEFLAPLGKLLASVIYAKRRSYALHELQLSCREPLRSPQQLLFYACRAVKDVAVSAWKVRVVEVDGARGKSTLVYEFSESERDHARSWLFNVVRPLALRWKELCTDTIATHLGEERSDAGVGKLLAAIRGEEQEHQKVAERYEQLLADEQSAPANAPKRAAVETEKAKLLEKIVASKYFRFVAGAGEGASSGGDRLANGKYTAHAMKLFLGTPTFLFSDVQAMARPTSQVFLTSSALPQLHATCDQIYLQRVATITSKYMAALQSRVQRARERVMALAQFRALCQRALTSEETELAGTTALTRGGRTRHTLSPGKEVEVESLLPLQRETIALVERALSSPNVYFGLWEPALRAVRYTSASASSAMAGKTLKRGHGVSFVALAKQIPVVVSRQDAVDGGEVGSYFQQLRYFTNERGADRKWPFIAVPLGTLGVLALDNMEAYETESQEPQPELGVVDFLRKVGQSFAEALAATRERTSLRRQQLRDEALVRVMTSCENFKPTARSTGAASLYLPHLVLQQIENALNGVDAYIGMTDPLCERLRFVCASSGSGMEGKTVDTTQSLSFRVFASQRSVVIPHLAQFFTQQEISQQHNSEHGQKLKCFGGQHPPQGPLVCVPIPFVGVLTVDTFPGAAGGAFSPSLPEGGVVLFLEKVANHLGENLRTLAANDARKLLPTLFRGNRTTFELLFEAILAVISRNLVAVSDMQALRFERDERTGRWREKGVLASLRRSTTSSGDTAADSSADEGLLVVQSLEERFKPAQQAEDPGDEVDNATELPPVHQLPRSPEVLVVHCSSTRDVTDDEAALVPTVLVLRRVKGATWMYDEEFLLSILPLVDSLVALANVRVEGIVARRLAARKLEALCVSLDRLPAPEAVEAMYTTVLPAAMETVAQAMSRGRCDAYLGQRGVTARTKSSASHLELRYVAASSRSLMQGVSLSLEAAASSPLTVVQSLRRQQRAVVDLSREPSPVQALSAKPAQRVFLTAPMGDNHVLCADSLGQEAFVPGQKPVVEPDIVSFFTASASRLQDAVLSTRHRLSYAQLRGLTTRAHVDLRLFHATILDGLRRDLVSVHSQQIVRLGEDFTSSFRVEAWQRRSTRRPLKTLGEHFCSVNGCERVLIEHEVHSEAHVHLPMTNLPRTLDVSRARAQPAVGTEKHGAFTCACLATMLDASVTSQGGDAKLALCVFSHDAKANEERGASRAGRRSAAPRDYGDSAAFFTTYQRQYFFAFAAVAADVFAHVFRACALETFAVELLMLMQEHLDAKDGLVVRFGQEGSATNTGNAGAEEEATDDEGDGPTASSASTGLTGAAAAPVVLFSHQPGRALRGKLLSKVRRFEASGAPLAIFMTKKATLAPPVKDTKDVVRPSAARAQEDPAKRRGPTSLFGGRKLFRYGKHKQREADEEKAKQQAQLLEAAPALQALSPSRTQQLRHESVSLHVFVRALAFQGRRDVVVFTIDKQSIKAVGAVEMRTRRLQSRADALATRMRAEPPRGDEEIDARRFCVGSPWAPSDARGGGGFLLLSLLKEAQARFQRVEGAIGGAMRQFLTGAQATARDATPSTSAEAWRFLFATGSEGAATSTPTTALLCVALVACGSKRDTVVALSQTDLLKEYLRLQAGRKLLQVDPTDRNVWAALSRARALLRSFDEATHTFEPRPEDGGEAAGGEAEANAALHSLADLLLAQSAVVRYLKQLETEIARERRLLHDEPATTLQCCVRQSRARAELKTRRREFRAALTLQCAFRQHLARRRLLFMKWTRAAVRVQRAYRRKRQRAKGTRPQRFTAQLLSASQRYGARDRSASVAASETSVDGAWRTDMAAFGSFQEFLASRVGRKQLKKEEALMWQHRRQLEKERARLPRDEALREDVGDLFELLDDAGSGELSRERTAALITRLHVPLNEEEVADVVAMMDSDGSGGISMDEFLRWFAHEFPLLQKRAPRVCGIVSRRDWQWVIEQSARSAMLKRWRALRAGAMAPQTRAPPGVGDTSAQEIAIEEEGEENEDDD